MLSAIAVVREYAWSNTSNNLFGINSRSCVYVSTTRFLERGKHSSRRRTRLEQKLPEDDSNEIKFWLMVARRHLLGHQANSCGMG